VAGADRGRLFGRTDDTGAAGRDGQVGQAKGPVGDRLADADLGQRGGVQARQGRDGHDSATPGRRGRGLASALPPLVVLAALAGTIALAPRAGLSWPALSVGLVVAALARNRDDLLHSECALKLLWVMGGAIAALMRGEISPEEFGKRLDDGIVAALADPDVIVPPFQPYDAAALGEPE